jgi:hypothetical protein
VNSLESGASCTLGAVARAAARVVLVQLLECSDRRDVSLTVRYRWQLAASVY